MTSQPAVFIAITTNLEGAPGEPTVLLLFMVDRPRCMHAIHHEVASDIAILEAGLQPLACPQIACFVSM